MSEARAALSRHWPEYVIEAAGLGLFMVIAGICVVLVNAPGTIRAIASPDLRRGLVGIAMGATAIGIIYSPWGRQSGAHLNPAVTLTFFRLRKIQGTDAFCYAFAQLVGGLIGLLVASVGIGRAIEHPAVN